MKFWKLNLTILIGIVMVIVFVSCMSPAPSVEEPIIAQGIGVRPLVPFLTHYMVVADTDTWGILVDLDDKTNYPHFNTNSIILKSVQVNGELNTAMDWRLSLGVVTAVDASGTDIEWIHENTRSTATQFDYSWSLPEHGLNLLVTDESLEFVFTPQITTTTALTLTTPMLTMPGLVTATVEVGDLIGYMDEIADTSAITVSVDIGYNTE